MWFKGSVEQTVIGVGCPFSSIHTLALMQKEAKNSPSTPWPPMNFLSGLECCDGERMLASKVATKETLPYVSMLDMLCRVVDAQ